MSNLIITILEEMKRNIVYWEGVRDYTCGNIISNDKLKNSMMTIYNEIINRRKNEMEDLNRLFG